MSSNALHLTRAAAAAALLSLSVLTAGAQKVDKARLDTAERRAGKAAKVLADLAALPPEASIPKEIIERARAIAVFPDSTKTNLLIQKFWKGSGLMARRVAGGWGAPAFYNFAVNDVGWTRVKSDAPGMIMLLMDDAVLKKFEKDGIRLEAGEGPVGPWTPEVERRVQGAGILIYTLSEGQVRGASVSDDASTTAAITSDNDLNKAVYGLKAREVLWGKTPEGMVVPPAVAEFQTALAALSRR